MRGTVFKSHRGKKDFTIKGNVQEKKSKLLPDKLYTSQSLFSFNLETNLVGFKFQGDRVGVLQNCDLCLDRHSVGWLLFYKYIVVQLPVAIIAGVLYIRAIVTLNATRFNKRKKVLTIAFVLLWASWILISLPYGVFEFAISSKEFSTINYKSFLVVLNEIDDLYWNREKYLMYYTWENIFFWVKQSYGIMNSVILLILLKPLHENLINCWRLIFGRK